MHDCFQPLERGGIVDNTVAELFPIDLAGGRRAGKGRLDWRDRIAFIERVDGGVGVMHRHAGLSEQPRRRRFSHPDRAGQAKDKHS